MICPKCGAQIPDGSNFCTSCGNYLSENNPQPAVQQPMNTQNAVPNNNVNAGMQQPVYYTSPTDHTAEFSAKDISDNKVIAMVPYLLGIMGVIIALLASKESPYAYFHVRQALKITVVSTLISIIALLLCWTFIVPIVAGICAMILFVLKIICFFQVCSGKAKEPAIISSLAFLK